MDHHAKLSSLCGLNTESRFVLHPSFLFQNRLHVSGTKYHRRRLVGWLVHWQIIKLLIAFVLFKSNCQTFSGSSSSVREVVGFGLTEKDELGNSSVTKSGLNPRTDLSFRNSNAMICFCPVVIIFFGKWVFTWSELQTQTPLLHEDDELLQQGITVNGQCWTASISEIKYVGSLINPNDQQGQCGLTDELPTQLLPSLFHPLACYVEDSWAFTGIYCITTAWTEALSFLPDTLSCYTSQRPAHYLFCERPALEE